MTALDIEELLPGLVKMMVERFGREGKPMTTILLFGLWVTIVG